ncbi:MAG: response regulator transcription factor [Planctomycetota bacterium]
MGVGTIVIVEDETPIREGIAAALRGAGYEPIEAADGEAGLAAARRTGVDLVLLDLMLPKIDGTQVLEQLRRTHPSLPVIILTARGMEDDRVSGLTAGADDYVVKPFSARELVARVEAVLRRSPERPDVVTRLSVGRATVDLPRREIRVEGEPVRMLSETECEILTHLAANPGRVISREELLTRVWGLSGSRVETRTIDMHVARLRSKLTTDCAGEAEATITTVRGKGYMLGPSVRATDGPTRNEPSGGSG